MLDILFALNCVRCGFVLLKINERCDAVLFRKAGDIPFPVLMRAPYQIIRYANIERASGAACEYVNPVRHV
jgi:hypothetical protein